MLRKGWWKSNNNNEIELFGKIEKKSLVYLCILCYKFNTKLVHFQWKYQSLLQLSKGLIVHGKYHSQLFVKLCLDFYHNISSLYHNHKIFKLAIFSSILTFSLFTPKKLALFGLCCLFDVHI